MIFPADDLGADDPKPTALFAAAASAASANSWTSVNGWAVARVYTSIVEEYEAAQASAVVADFGAIARYSARGPDAAALLARATSAPVAGLQPGESARGLMLDERGGVVDIVETARLSDELFLLSSSRRHARRLQLASRGLDAVIEDISGRIAALAVIGPLASEFAIAAGIDLSGDALAAQGRVRGIETSARPIHFGALAGVEVIYPHEEALTLWERLRRVRGPRPAGLDTLEILRIEGGSPRPGVDFIPADIARADQRRLPAEIGLVHLAPPNRAWFNGRRALRTPVYSGRALVVLAIDSGAAAPGASVFTKKSVVGRLTSTAFSPRMKRVVAFAEIAVEAIGKPLEVAVPGDSEARAAAQLYETPESRFAQAFRAATETRG